MFFYKEQKERKERNVRLKRTDAQPCQKLGLVNPGSVVVCSFGSQLIQSPRFYNFCVFGSSWNDSFFCLILASMLFLIFLRASPRQDKAPQRERKGDRIRPKRGLCMNCHIYTEMVKSGIFRLTPGYTNFKYQFWTYSYCTVDTVHLLN